MCSDVLPTLPGTPEGETCLGPFWSLGNSHISVSRERATLSQMKGCQNYSNLCIKLDAELLLLQGSHRLFLDSVHFKAGFKEKCPAIEGVGAGLRDPETSRTEEAWKWGPMTQPRPGQHTGSRAEHSFPSAVKPPRGVNHCITTADWLEGNREYENTLLISKGKYSSVEGPFSSQPRCPFLV